MDILRILEITGFQIIQTVLWQNSLAREHSMALLDAQWETSRIWLLFVEKVCWLTPPNCIPT